MSNQRQQYEKLSADVLYKTISSGKLTEEELKICKVVYEEKAGHPFSGVIKNPNTEQNVTNSVMPNDYKTGVSIAKFVSLIGWLVCLGSAIGLFVAFGTVGNAGFLALLPVLGVFAAGLILVVAGQSSRALFDNANYTKSMLEILSKEN